MGKQDVDLIIVVGGTTSHEGDDRDHLHLDDGADDLITSAASGGPVCPSGELHFADRGSCCCDCSWAQPSTCGHDDGSCCFQCCYHSNLLTTSNVSRKSGAGVLGKSDANANKNRVPVVVLLEVPGAVLMPWADVVDAIAVMFLGGQETGNAWASVLFGDYAPTGHLPLSIPSTEDDTIAPSSSQSISFNEGMATGYRAPTKKYTFPFGHGLTYTNFTYGYAKQHKCGVSHCISLSIRNTGHVAASTVPQLYVEFPSDAGYTSPVLKGFQKTAVIQPGSDAEVTFTLTDADLSYWTSGQFHKASTFTVHVGASSADIRETLPLVFDSSGTGSPTLKHAPDSSLVIV